MTDKGYVLNYWNIPGRGESIRVMFALANVEFKNNFIPLPLPLDNPTDINPPPFDDGTWGRLKPKTPWGSLPTLLLPSGKVIGQQRSILRYLAKNIKYKGKFLYPPQADEAVQVDSFMDMLEDIWPILIGLNGPDSMDTAPLYSKMLGHGTLNEFLNPRMKFGSGDLAAQFDFLEGAMSDEGPFLLGRDISCADILLFAAIAWWGAGMFGNMNIMLDNRPKLERSITQVGKIESISNYYKALIGTRQEMPIVGSTHYSEFYTNFHILCRLI